MDCLGIVLVAHPAVNHCTCASAFIGSVQLRSHLATGRHCCVGRRVLLCSGSALYDHRRTVSRCLLCCTALRSLLHRAALGIALHCVFLLIHVVLGRQQLISGGLEGCAAYGLLLACLVHACWQEIEVTILILLHDEEALCLALLVLALAHADADRLTHGWLHGLVMVVEVPAYFILRLLPQLLESGFCLLAGVDGCQFPRLLARYHAQSACLHITHHQCTAFIRKRRGYDILVLSKVRATPGVALLVRHEV